MEKACIGSVVRSKCGRDKKRIFLIVGVCDDGTDRVLLADGDLHPLSKPKKKNLAHIAVLAAAGIEGTSFQKGSDSEITAYLSSFEKRCGDK